MHTRMFYVDDSGAGLTGHVVFSWIECDITTWTVAMRGWLDLRKRLYEEFRIPPAYELHASLFINGRGRPSTEPSWNLQKSNRIEAARLAMETIGRYPELRLGTVYRRFAKAGELGSARAGLYQALITRLNQRLATEGELGLLFVDGDGTDPAYDDAHRSLKLQDRRIVEDPVFRVSGKSQWIQMADFIAYVAYQGLLREPRRRALWTWYDQYLRASDVAGGPMEL